MGKMGSLDVESLLSALQVDPPEAPLGGSYLWNACRSGDFPNESSPVT